MMLLAYRVIKCFNKKTLFMHICAGLTLSVKEALSGNSINENVRLKGWVQAVRKHKNLVFIDLIDGRSLDRLQVVIKPDERNIPAYGSSISVEGSLIKSEQKGQEVELLCNMWDIIGPCPEDYPFLARHYHTVEYVRQLQHLRPKTRTFKSVLRVRNSASMAIHSFFQAQGFQFIHTPIITLNDCEGAGEVFSVKHEKKVKMQQTVKATDRQCINGIQSSYSNNKDENTKIDIPSENFNGEEFFKDPAYLTVSGQLHLEAVACALSQVYSFGPVFRAESSHSNCHLSEFYMIEVEIAFAESLEDLTKLVEACIKNVSKHILEVCEPEIDLLCQKYTTKHEKYVKKIIETPFVHMSYLDALNILEKNKKYLKTQIKWGVDFSSEHLKFLMKYCNSIPVFISHYPKLLKPFYMKTNESGEAYCFDLYAPFGGEICGGSLREENESALKNHLDALKITDSLSWYLELRKYGTVPHGGFGIGFDRLLQFLLGISNIRDVTPFPRWNDHCKL